MMNEPTNIYWYVVAFFLFWGVIVTAIGLRTLKTQRSFSRWVTAQGRIIESSVWKHRSGGMGDAVSTSSFEVRISFEYQTGTSQLVGNRRRIAEPYYDDKAEAEQVAAQYVAGSTVQVLYDPENPQHAFLEIDESVGNYVPLVAGLALLAVAVLVLLTRGG